MTYISCCKDCKIRHIGCHSTCEDYIEEKRISEKINRSKNKDAVFKLYAKERDIKFKRMERHGKIKKKK